MEIESFKKAGAIPFKWEIRPGVPKLQHSQQQPIASFTKLEEPREKVCEKNESPPVQLKPPPAAGFNFQPPIAGARNRSFRSAPRARSDRHVLTRPVTGVGCFPRAREKKKTGPEPDYLSDLETVSRWSVSSRKSISPFHDSLSSSFSSRESSVSDGDWVGWALF